MRPLRLLLSLTTSILALTLLIYASLGSEDAATSFGSTDSTSPGSRRPPSRIRAFFSFSGPSALFPPSAIISLTDDNSTFFLARPAAFGPALPSRGLSGQLWIGSGFGDDGILSLSSTRGGLIAGAEGELGCSDVPGWSEGDRSTIAAAGHPGTSRQNIGKGHGSRKQVEDKGTNDKPRKDDKEGTKAKRSGEERKGRNPEQNDGTDDWLHHPLPDSGMSTGSSLRSSTGKAAEHADIQSLQEGAEIAGKVVLLSRGGCGFLEKVKWAQRRGAVAVIVGDNVPGGPLLTMYAHGDTSNITTPALFTSHTTAHLLSSLIPAGGYIEDIPSPDAANVGVAAGNKGTKPSKSKAGKASKTKDISRPTFTKTTAKATKTPRPHKTRKRPVSGKHLEQERSGWLWNVFSLFGIGRGARGRAGGESSRPPSSGEIDWVLLENFEDEPAKVTPAVLPTTSTKSKGHKSTPAPVAVDDFVIGVQDWRDPDLLPQTTPAPSIMKAAEQGKSSGKKDDQRLKGGNVMPGSGEYGRVENDMDTGSSHGDSRGQGQDDEDDEGERKGWLGSFHWSHEEENDPPIPVQTKKPVGEKTGRPQAQDDGQRGPTRDSDEDAVHHHEGLWVTLTPTTMSSSPFFDTLLVLVVSPLVTLTIVYALLLLRSRIRRRRWRAPKSVVESLPVRTYHTISSSDNSASPSPVPTPTATCPTTPLLQQADDVRGQDVQPQRPRLHPSAASEGFASTSSVAQYASGGGGGSSQRSLSPGQEQEKREAGLAEWRRRYGGRQKECVVCLEEYIDGVSRVKSLPCGHEFHDECITPWLTTRRRTCPICKGDVVRSFRRNQLQQPSTGREDDHPRAFDTSELYHDGDETDLERQEEDADGVADEDDRADTGNPSGILSSARAAVARGVDALGSSLRSWRGLGNLSGSLGRVEEDRDR